MWTRASLGLSPYDRAALPWASWQAVLPNSHATFLQQESPEVLGWSLMLAGVWGWVSPWMLVGGEPPEELQARLLGQNRDQVQGLVKQALCPQLPGSFSRSLGFPF